MKTYSAGNVIQVWCSGDFVYGAVRESLNYPAGTAQRFVDGREYPVAQLAMNGLESYTVVRWISRTERFPEPLEHFNR